MVEHLLSRIEMKMNTFSKGQKRIATFIEEHYDRAAFMTASKLGTTVGVSESTVVRFATELGYSGYPKLQKAMQEMIRDKLTSVQRIDVTTNRIGNDDVLDSIMNQDIDKIRRTLEETSHDDFKKAVKSIVNARRIYIFGVRSTASLAQFLGYYFGLIFDNVRVITDTSKTHTYEQLFRIDQNDVMIGISFPRYSTMAVDSMTLARERGANVIAITDSMVSPLVSAADEVLIARSDMASVVDSLVAPLSLINALIVATVLEKKDEVTETFKELEKVYSGDIAAAIGLKQTTTGDTLCDENHPIILESMEFPEPVINLAIEPKTKAGQEKMGIALAKLAEEDPTFRTWTDEETGQTIIAGMGELHLDIIVDRLLREFKVEANVGAPQVSYKETIKGNADVDYKYKKQSGGSGQYGHVKIRVSPNEPGKGYEFINSVVGGSIPKEYIPAVDAGIKGAMQAGILAGYQVVDVKVELYDGSYHEVDSSEMAFKIAGSMAFKEAMRKANPALMEPIMKVSVIAPDDYLGNVIGDLSSRRGEILGQETRPGSVQVDALVPLSEMFGYSNTLRSNTQGRGQYSMEPHSFKEVPKNIAEDIMNKRSKD